MNERGMLAAVWLACWPLSPALGQSIDIVDSDGDCNITIQPFTSTNLYVRASPGGAVDGFTGVEFRIDGLLPNLPLFLNLMLPYPDFCMGNTCDLFGVGARAAFPSCQDAPVVVFTVNVFALGPIPEMELTVRPHSMPSAPVFLPCPLFTGCAPDFTYACVEGGRALVNSARACDEPVAVDASSWTRVKALYGAP